MLSPEKLGRKWWNGLGLEKIKKAVGDVSPTF
jgi:hypothetical protein